MLRETIQCNSCDYITTVNLLSQFFQSKSQENYIFYIFGGKFFLENYTSLFNPNMKSALHAVSIEIHFHRKCQPSKMLYL